MSKTLSKSLMHSIRAMFKEVVRCELDLKRYQDTAVDFLEENPYSALFIDLGLGKTIICLTLLHRLLGRFAYRNCLVIAPLRVATQTWPTEIGLWQHTAYMSHVLIRADDEEYVKLINEAGKQARKKSFYYGVSTFDENGKRLPNKPLEHEVNDAKAKMKERILRRLATTPACLHIISREQVEWIVDLFGDKWPFDIVIVDESSSFKDHTTKRFKALKKVVKYTKRFHLLTATPAAETYMHLFPQIYLLDQGERFGRQIGVFRERYFTYNQYSRKYKIRPGAEEEISAKIADICLVMKAEDHLDMKKPLYLMRPIVLSKVELDQYRQFESEMILKLPNGVEIEAETAAALAQKLMQIASGSVYGAEKSRHWIHDHKIEDLKQVIEELDGEPIIVSYWFDESLQRLKKAFPHAVEMDKAGHRVKDWNKGKIKILLVQPASVAFGLNMQHGGHHMYIFDLFYSLELYLQLIGRIQRQGQTKLVRIYHAVAAQTIDVTCVSALVEKQDAQERLFSRIKRLRIRLLARRAAAQQIADRSAL
jgi:SNF2 family DNA or RNA helicase